jgi:molybdate/tungstate transport system ATP-binding protein
MIAIDNLSVAAGTFALERLSFQVASGQYAVLMGRTGSGKSTLLEAICGLKRVRHGRIRLLDRDVTHLKAAERGIGYVPQDRALFPAMTVWDHLAFALVIRRWDSRRIADRVMDLADLLGIGRLLERKPAGLSGGEAQRVALGRALAFEPHVLLLDEPLSALDDETRQNMCELLRAIQRRTGVTTLHVTHNQTEAMQLADRLLVLNAGVVAEMALNRLGNGAVGRARSAEVRP